jgi:hypothetical protein
MTMSSETANVAAGATNGIRAVRRRASATSRVKLRGVGRVVEVDTLSLPWIPPGRLGPPGLL